MSWEAVTQEVALTASYKCAKASTATLAFDVPDGWDVASVRSITTGSVNTDVRAWLFSGGTTAAYVYNHGSSSVSATATAVLLLRRSSS